MSSLRVVTHASLDHTHPAYFDGEPEAAFSPDSQDRSWEQISAPNETPIPTELVAVAEVVVADRVADEVDPLMPEAWRPSSIVADEPFTLWGGPPATAADDRRPIDRRPIDRTSDASTTPRPTSAGFETFATSPTLTAAPARSPYGGSSSTEVLPPPPLSHVAAASIGAQPWGPPGAPTAAAQPPSKLSAFAVTSLVLGIVGIFTCILLIPPLVALLFGLVARRRITDRKGRQRGRGLAIAGIVLGSVGTLGGAAGWIFIEAAQSPNEAARPGAWHVMASTAR